MDQQSKAKESQTNPNAESFDGDEPKGGETGTKHGQGMPKPSREKGPDRQAADVE